MRHAELEDKVLAIIDAVRQKTLVEGSFVELKARWPDAKRAARHLAAHCNAAGGDPVLWLIGLNEEEDVVGASKEELAEWWPQVQTGFDREPPTLTLAVPVHSDDKTVVALLFDSSRAPFVVRNPQFNQPGGDRIQFEVPWREGNATRTARREDLLRILVPAAKVPELEVLNAYALLLGNEQGWLLHAEIEIYATVRSKAVFVGHRTSVTIDPDQLSPRTGSRFERRFVDLNSAAERRDVVLEHPGAFLFKVDGEIGAMGPGMYFPHQLTLSVDFGIVDLDTRPSLALTLSRQQALEQRVQYGDWKLVAPNRN